MAFPLLLLYLILTYVRPFELYPQLGSLRIMLWLGLVTVVVSLFQLLLQNTVALRARQLYLMAGFVSAILVSRLQDGWLGGLVIAFTDFGIEAVLFFVVLLSVNTLFRLRVVIVLVVLLTLLTAAQGILAYHFGIAESTYIFDQRQFSGTVPPDEEGGVEILRRIKSLGFLDNPNNLAQALLMALPFLGLAWRRHNWTRNFFLVFLPGAVLLYATYLTFSRTAVICLVVFALMAFRSRVGNVKAAVLAGVLLVGMIGLQFGGGRSFSSQEASAYGRIAAWRAGMSMLRSAPLFGIGFGGFSEANTENHLTAHNSFVLCYAELGLVGYFVWLSLLVFTFHELAVVRKLPSDEEDDDVPDLQRYARALEMSFVAFLTCCYFASRTYNTLLYLLFGLAAALACIARPRREDLFVLRFRQWVPRTVLIEVFSIIFLYVMIRISQ